MDPTALRNQSSEGVLFAEEKAGRFTLGVISLNQPRSLNTLDLTILRSMGEKLLQWRNWEDIACIVLHASSERAFCAGSDIKPLIAELQEDHDSLFTKEYFAAEYFVDYLIHVYPKPILCWADGISMGGGIGIMTGACCRVVTERSVIAMPEIAIGFFTDVEATYFLNRLPLGLGLFLGLTGARFEGFDAVALRMADDSGDIIVISRYLLGRSSDFSQAQISPGQFLNQLYKRLVFRWPSWLDGFQKLGLSLLAIGVVAEDEKRAYTPLGDVTRIARYHHAGNPSH